MELDRLEDVGRYARQVAARRLLLVVDAAAYEPSGAAARLAAVRRSMPTVMFRQLDPNPKLEDVQRGLALARPTADDLVLAVGGGSTLDLVKLMCHFAAQGAVDQAAVRHLLTNPSAARPRTCRLVAVPTTAGTGSEATHFAVLYVDGQKHSVAHRSLLADAVVLDAALTESMPPSVAAASGLDAVTQAIEAMWSNLATAESIAWAAEALRLGLTHLVPAVQYPSAVHRRGMLQAAHLAGRAISVSRTTAAHALSYTLTIRYSVPHGMAVALCLQPLLRRAGRLPADAVCHPRGADGLQPILQQIAAAFGVDPHPLKLAMPQVAARWSDLLAEVGCPPRLRQWGVTEPDDLRVIATGVNAQRLANHPWRLNEEDLEAIVAEMAWEGRFASGDR